MTVTLGKNGALSYNPYVRKGGMLVLRSALHCNDPDFLYNYIKDHGYEPEEYGIFHPAAEEYANYTRAQLIAELVDLKDQLEIIYRSGFA